MEFVEGVGESSSPPRSYGSFGGGGASGGGGNNDVIRNDVYNRLIENENEEAISNPDFLEQLEAHFNRLPTSYGLDINMEKVEDVLLHQKLLASAKDPDNQPVFHIRFLENVCTRGNDFEGEQISSALPVSFSRDIVNNGVHSSNDRNSGGDYETCSKLGDLNLDVKKDNDVNKEICAEDFAQREEAPCLPIHEIIFSTLDKPKLLSQLSALLSDAGLNIREAHVFSTIDGYSLDIFVVDGWHSEDTEGLYNTMRKAIAESEGSWSGSSRSQSILDKAIAAQRNSEDWEIDWRLLKIGEKIAAGSCGDLYRGVYLYEDVAVKVLRSEHLNNSLEAEFAQEVAILRQVQHDNVVRFIGACTKLPHLCIVTEYMPRGSLYEYLHKNHPTLKLPQLLKFTIDVCKGMEYLHQKNVIHRDLKTANLLMDTSNVVKVADFGVARFQNNGGVMTAETGTYRWMAPEPCPQGCESTSKDIPNLPCLQAIWITNPYFPCCTVIQQEAVYFLHKFLVLKNSFLPISMKKAGANPCWRRGLYRGRATLEGREVLSGREAAIVASGGVEATTTTAYITEAGIIRLIEQN